MNTPLNLHDLEQAARRHLPRAIFGYVASGSEDEITLRRNRAVFEGYQWLPRVLTQASSVCTSVDLWGHRYALPFGIAPLGMSALIAYRGDQMLARTAVEAGLPMIISGSSLIRLEEIVPACPHAWFQAYLPGQPPQIDALLDRVAAAGINVLVITVDTPVAANRENHIRAGFNAPLRPSLRLLADGLLHPRWTFGTFLRTLVRHGMPHFENNYATRGAPIVARHVLRDFSDRSHLGWQHLKHIRSRWEGKLIIKGLLNPLDADIAVAEGADALIVSNHGGRQLDGAASPLSVLPQIARRSPVPVMFDSGIRRGGDVLKAYALGARMVFVGRPFIYAAAVAGQAGIAQAVALLHAEVRRDMAMLGISRLEDLDPQIHLHRQAGMLSGTGDST